MNIVSYPLPGLVIQRASDVNCAGHIFDGKRSSEISSGYLVTYSGRCKNKQKTLLLFSTGTETINMSKHVEKVYEIVYQCVY